MAYDAFLKLVVDNSDDASAALPSARARSASTKRHSGGMRRCRHLSILASDAPSAFASRRTSAQDSWSVIVMNTIMDNLSSSSSPIIPVTARRVLGQWVQEQTNADKMSRNPISERTRQARLASGLTQEQLAKQLGVEVSTYAKWENRSQSTIPDRYKAAFCTIVRVDPTWLITGERWPEPLHHEPEPVEGQARPRKRAS